MFFVLCSLFVFISFLLHSSTFKMSIALLFSLEWTILSLLVCAMELPRDEYAFFFVLINIIAFSLPYLLSFHSNHTYNRGTIYRLEKTNAILQKKEENFVKIDKYVIALNILALIYIGYTFGFSLLSFQSEEALMLQMNSVSSSRYSGDDYNLPVLNRLVNTLVYAACGIEGFFMCCKKNKFLFINLMLLFGQTILTNTKATIVFGFAFWASGYITGIKFFNKRISRKKVILALLAVVGVLFFTVMVNYFRRRGTFTIQDEFRTILTAYLIGPYSAFSLWYSSAPQPTMELGMNTFSCVFSWLGIREHVNGDFIYSSQLVTNVYTIFKHLINDYSYIGTIMFFFIVGTISAAVDKAVSRINIRSVGFSIVLTSMILTAFFSSIFRYSTNLIACIIIIFFSLFINIKTVK